MKYVDYPSKQEKSLKVNWKTNRRKFFEVPLDFSRTYGKYVLWECIASCRTLCEIFGPILKFENNDGVRAFKCCVKLLFRTVLTTW